MKRVQLPTGEIGEFPDEMPDAAIEQVLARQFAPDQTPAETQRLAAHQAPPRSMLTDALLGVGDVMRGSSNTINRTLRGLTGGYAGAPEQKVAEGPQTGDYVGAIGTDVALSAVPVAKVGSILTRALSRAPAAPLVANVLANAGYSAATNDEDRSTAALMGGAGTAIGAGVGRVASGLVKPTDVAARLLREGVDLTPGQAGGGVGMGRAARFWEQASDVLPGIGPRIKKAQESAISGWNRNLLGQAEREGLVDAARSAGSDAKIGREGVKEVQKAFSGKYKEMFPEGTMFKFDDALQSEYADITDRLAKKLPPSTLGKFNGITEWIDGRLTEGVPANQWKEVIEGEIDSAMKAARRDGQNSLVTALSVLDKHLERALPKFEGSTIGESSKKAVDTGYRTFSVLKQTGQKAGPVKRGGVIYPADLAVTAAKKGHTELEDKALEALGVFGNAPTKMDKAINFGRTGLAASTGLVHPGLAAVPAAMALLGSTEIGRKVILGQYPLQKFLQENPQMAMQLARAISQQGANANE